MNKSYSQKIVIALLLTVFLVPAALVFAQTTPAGNQGTVPTTGGNIAADKIPTLQNPLKVDSIASLVKNFVEIFTYIVVLFAVLALIYVGLQFILAQGKPDKLTELKKWLYYIIIGVAIVIGARVIIDIVIGTLQSSGTVDPSVIQAAKDANTR